MWFNIISDIIRVQLFFLINNYLERYWLGQSLPSMEIKLVPKKILLLRFARKEDDRDIPVNYAVRIDTWKLVEVSAAKG